MKKKFFAGLVVVALAVPAGMALAQEEQQPDKVEYKKKTIIDFSDVTIQGELTKPEGAYVLNRKKTSFKTLLKIRGNFLPELMNSTDNL
ncbi:MAG: hypothetical protein U1E65_23540 [Myxococcota bacterium]